jgi:uncharacterized protein YcbX
MTERLPIVGVVQQLYRYPVKSMRGQSLDAAPVYWHGLAGDRRYAFVRAGNISRFPWLTGREVPQLLRYSPYHGEDGDPGSVAVRVRTPEGDDFAVEDAALRDELAARHGAEVQLLHSSRGIPDSAAVSILGAASVRELGERVGMNLDPIRFRANILVATTGDRPFEEEEWLGGLLIFGDRPDSARIRANRKDPRCMMVNLDPELAEQNPAVLRAIVRERDTCAGLYASVEAIGTIQVGDPVCFVGA